MSTVKLISLSRESANRVQREPAKAWLRFRKGLFVIYGTLL
jgi:hypothetical protein